ncbi:MAG: IS1249 family transposase [Arcanobacterium sp.]|nr:IS1249 family transposase [Arcanobacterium sp.]
MRRPNPHARRCPICQTVTKKNGSTSAGRQRWRCPACGHSFTSTHRRQQREKQFREFVEFITDTEPKRRLTGSTRTWDRDHAWCWDTRPIWDITGEVHDQIFIDGTYIAHGWCVLVAASTDGVIAYQLCAKESKAAYTALLSRIPAPAVVTTDGNKGALAAIKTCWPTARIQRCLVHIQRNIRRTTTSRPRIKQHKALYKLALDLTKITTTEEAIEWQKGLSAFHSLYDQWLAERTYKHTVPASQVPKFAVNNKSWWYTHHHTRRIVRSLDRYVKDNVLFTYLDLGIDRAQPLAATTNPLEGGINAPLKGFLHAHRGWSEEHMLTALDYWLYNRSINPQPLETFITNTRQARPEPNPKPTSDQPTEIDNHIDHEHPWEDGLHIRKGWIQN